MSVKFKPLTDRVLIEPETAVQKTEGGILIPGSIKEKPLQGTIVAIGNGKKDEPLTVQVGQEVIFGKHSGSEIKLGEKTYIVMRESEIYGIL